MTHRSWLSSRNLAGVGAAAVVLTVAPMAHAEDRYAAIVYDATTNEVLHADQADETRYPASLTKMMTLYLLFDALDRGDVTLSTPMAVSRRAQLQPPSRLGLREGDTITVEDAISALVTRSANDVAVVVAEKLDGNESRFAARMTMKARALGMQHTRYANASGLPDPGQVTTARDVLVLSQALLRDHPRRYAYFQTEAFSWRNVYSRNHNSLLGRVEGVDGIKTGYTRASGFNLASSAVRNGHRIFAVVMGGESAASRDAQMAYLIDSAFTTISAKLEGRPTPPTAQYTSLPVNRVAITGAGIARPGETEDMGEVEALVSAPAPAPSAAPAAVSMSVTATVAPTSADADQPSYVVPFPVAPRAYAPAPAPAAAPAPITGDVQIRGPIPAAPVSGYAAQQPVEGMGASVAAN